MESKKAKSKQLTMFKCNDIEFIYSFICKIPSALYIHTRMHQSSI